jgi:hypothetical protein
MSEEEKEHKLLNSTMSRKGFVAMTGAAGLAAFLAACGGSDSSSDSVNEAEADGVTAEEAAAGGSFDPVELLRLLPLLSHQLPWQRRGLAPLTTTAARLLDLPWDGVLREGSPADLLVLGCAGWPDLLTRAPQRRVLRAGRWLPPPAAEQAAVWFHCAGALPS